MIKAKQKFCDGCLTNQFIWKNHQGKKYCLTCWQQKSPAKVYVSRKPIKSISPKMADKLAVYRRKRDKFLKENPVCQFPGCKSTQVTLHHSKGRIGSFLTDKKWFKSLCWPHHLWVETHPEEAKELQLSYDR